MNFHGDEVGVGACLRDRGGGLAHSGTDLEDQRSFSPEYRFAGNNLGPER
jgi:hypothetical protein